jgi:short-subunit dehydrogenase
MLAVVTGAASGIGRALARELAAGGADVVLADVDEERAEEAAREVHGRARRLDVTDARAVEALVTEIGDVDLFVNNAGIAIGGEARDLSLDDWRKVLAVNLTGTIHGIAAVYPRMVRRGRGHILNVASVGGLSPYPLALPYTASKHAVVGLSLALRAEAAALGVKVSVACPGMVNTPIWSGSVVRGFDPSAVVTRAKSAMTPERCARAILRGVERNEGLIVVTAEARLLWWLHRASPGASVALHSAAVRFLRRRYRSCA